MLYNPVPQSTSLQITNCNISSELRGKNLSIRRVARIQKIFLEALVHVWKNSEPFVSCNNPQLFS